MLTGCKAIFRFEIAADINDGELNIGLIAPILVTTERLLLGL